MPPGGLGGGSRCSFCEGKETLLGGAGNALRVVVAPCTNRPATPPCAHTTRWWAGGGMGGVFAATLGAWGRPPSLALGAASPCAGLICCAAARRCSGAPTHWAAALIWVRGLAGLCTGHPKPPGWQQTPLIFFSPPLAARGPAPQPRGGVGAPGGGGSWQATPPGWLQALFFSSALKNCIPKPPGW